jgi:hypothetical protein
MNMQTVRQAATRRQENIPAGESHYHPRPTNPFQLAHWSQFVYPKDGRKATARAKGRQRYLAALWYIGPTMTAQECARITRTPVKTIKTWRQWTLNHPGGELRALAVNIDSIPDRRRRAHGHFDGDRIYKLAHPERLQPIAKGFKRTRRESGPPVIRESGPLDSRFYSESKNNFATRTDRHSGKNAAAPAPEKQSAKPNPTTPSEFLIELAIRLQCGIFEADGYAGWTLKRHHARKHYQNPIGPHVRNPLAYFTRAAHNLDEQKKYESGGVTPFLEKYSYAEMLGVDIHKIAEEFHN